MDELTFGLTVLCPTAIMSCIIMMIALGIDTKRKGLHNPVPDKEVWTLSFILIFIIVPVINIILSIYFFYKVVNNEYDL